MNRMDALATVVREILLGKEQLYSSGNVAVDKNQTTRKDSAKKEYLEEDKKPAVEKHDQGRGDKVCSVSLLSSQTEKARGDTGHHSNKVVPSFPFNGESGHHTSGNVMKNQIKY